MSNKALLAGKERMGRQVFTVNHIAIAVIVAMAIAVGVTLLVVNSNSGKEKVTEEKVQVQDTATPGETPGGTAAPAQLRAGDKIVYSSDYTKVDLQNTGGIDFTFTYTRPQLDPKNPTGIYFKAGDVMSVGFEQRSGALQMKSAGIGITFQDLDTVVMPLKGTFKVQVRFQGPTQPPAETGNEIAQTDFFINDTKYGPYISYTQSKEEIFRNLSKITSLARLNNFNTSEVDVTLT